MGLYSVSSSYWCMPTSTYQSFGSCTSLVSIQKRHRNQSAYISTTQKYLSSINKHFHISKVYYNPLYLVLFPVCALFFQPAIKYYGVGKVVQKSLEPFYKPFVVQWQHSRTKRERSKVLNGNIIIKQ